MTLDLSSSISVGLLLVLLAGARSHGHQSARLAALEKKVEDLQETFRDDIAGLRKDVQTLVSAFSKR